MEVNKALFYNACYQVTVSEHERYNIGTYKEKKLHIILKHYFEQNEELHEIPYKGFIADIKNGNSITEIETNGLSGKCDKLAAFLPDCKVNIVIPLACERYVSWVSPEDGSISPKHKARRKDTLYDVFYEIYKIRKYVKDPNLTITIASLVVDEYRMLNGWSKDKKRGSTRYERIPTDLVELKSLNTDEDYMALIPESVGEKFTASQFAKACKIKSEIAYSVLSVLIAKELVLITGKEGRSNIYTRLK